MTAPPLAIVVPVLDEAARIAATLQALQPMRARGVRVIVVDGGSQDHSVTQAAPWADLVIDAARGRARQMNAGAAAAPEAAALLFLHADTRLPPDADLAVAQALAGRADWGRFDVRIDGRSRWLPLVGTLMNLRSRLGGIATGDQAMFVRRAAFERVGGFPDQPLMEDIELSRRLRTLGRPACLRARVVTSGRRWDERGAWRTIVLMWRLRWRYWRGESPHALARAYR
ncbi:MAG: TIGR04283 family arsenosugar biosynthesis glycosyltransferase [Rubrivivax sp.]